MQSILTSAASPSSTIDVCIAIVLLRRPRFEGDLFQVLEKICASGVRQSRRSRPRPEGRASATSRRTLQERGTGVANWSILRGRRERRAPLRHEDRVRKLPPWTAQPRRVTAGLARSPGPRHAGTPRRIRRAPSRPCRKRRHRRGSRPTSARRGSRRSFRFRLSRGRALASSGSSVTATTCSLWR